MSTPSAVVAPTVAEPAAPVATPSAVVAPEALSPDQQLQVLMAAQGRSKSPLEMEYTLAMTSMVNEFRSIALAVQEGQKHTVAWHQELRSQREEQQ
eukprot:9472170-Alexandrium_andersonii.AAC.1